MPDFVFLTCLSCGTKLQIQNDIKRFACSNCGNEYFVKRSGGTVSLIPIQGEAEIVENRTDKTDNNGGNPSTKHTIEKINKEINKLNDQKIDFIKAHEKTKNIFIVVAIIFAVVFLVFTQDIYFFGIILVLAFLFGLIFVGMDKKTMKSNLDFISEKVKKLKEDKKFIHKINKPS